MKRFALIAVLTIFSVPILAQTTPGLYLDRGKNGFSRIDHAPVAESGTKGVVKSMFVPGVMPSGIWKFAGKSAPLATSVHPRFVYRLRVEQDLSGRDLVLIRLDQRSDHREARVVRMSAWTGNGTGGFDKKNIVSLKLTEHDGFIEFEPAQDLVANGDYFITANLNPRGYDFHVDSAIPVTSSSTLSPEVRVVKPVEPTPKRPDSGVTDREQVREMSLGEAARKAREKNEPPR
jgi:hypothetical protein